MANKVDEALEGSNQVLMDVRKLLSKDWQDFTHYDWPNELRERVSKCIAANREVLGARSEPWKP